MESKTRILKDISLIKPGQKHRSHILPFATMSPLIVMGGEESKYRLELPNPHGSRELTFFTKQVSNPEEAAQIYADLKSKHYPVPTTARYFSVDNISYLAMSDMTDGGAYSLWGYSNEPDKNQKQATQIDLEQLSSMHLSEQDLEHIERLAFSLVERGQSDGYTIHFHHLHVRRHRESDKIDIVLLDLGSEINNPSIYDQSVDQVKQFMHYLRRALANCKAAESLPIKHKPGRFFRSRRR